MFKQGKTLDWPGYIIGVVAIALATGGSSFLFTLTGVEIRIYTISAVYVCIVLAISIIWGARPGIITATISFLALNYFFLEPRYSFQVRDPQDGVQLFFFLATAVITSRLAVTARNQASLANNRVRMAQILGDFTQALILNPRPDQFLTVVATRIGQASSAVTLNIYLITEEHTLVQGATYIAPSVGTFIPAERISSYNAILAQDALSLYRDGMTVLRTMEGKIVNAITTEGDPDEPLCENITLPLFVGSNLFGVLGAAKTEGFSFSELNLLNTLVGQTALAMDYARLVEENSRLALIEESMQLKSTLLASVSHELRTPLTAIRTLTTNLQNEAVSLSSLGRDFLEGISTETERLIRIVRDILDLSKLEAGVLKADKEWYLFSEVLNTVLSRLRASLAGRPLNIMLAIPEPLIPFDFLQIDQVLTNLLENALKYTPSGTPIEIVTTFEGDDFFVEIRDHGPGIPVAESENIFRSFYQVNNLTHNEGGIGFGLAIARGIIETHGGRIWFEETTGGGASFKFTLPQHDEGVWSDQQKEKSPLG